MSGFVITLRFYEKLKFSERMYYRTFYSRNKFRAEVS